MSDELSSLDRAIAEVDGIAQAPAREAAEQEHADAAQGWAEIPQAVGMLLVQFLPELKSVYSDERCTDWGRHMARLSEKYGWSTDGLPVEVTVGMSTAGFILPTMLAIKARRAAAQQPQQGAAHGDAQHTA